MLDNVVRENKNLGRVRYKITFDPRLPHLPAILNRNWKVMVESDQQLKNAFPQPPMACLKRGKNLTEELTRAKLPRQVRGTVTRSGQGQQQG